jgi:serine-type D-Ala-D-Ala endopeptidase (penicillin-binding protein 7)
LPRIQLRATINTFAKKKTAYYLFGAILGIAALISLIRSDQSIAHSDPSLKRPQHKTENPLKPYLDPNRLFLRSGVALVMDEGDGAVLLDKNIHIQRPIASLTKLMTAMVTLDSNLPRDETIAITKSDRDRLRGSKSRLSFGTKLTRRDLLKISLAASENRAASALARTFPGGKDAFVSAMNEKARKLGMEQTAFRDAAGLHSNNVSTAADLSILVAAAYRYPLIREFSTTAIDYVTDLRSGWKIEFVNTNRLVRGKRWDIDLSKTGYIADAGHCLVMRAIIADRPVVMVLLNSWGTLSKFGDANRIRKWMDQANQKAQQT